MIPAYYTLAAFLLGSIVTSILITLFARWARISPSELARLKDECASLRSEKARLEAELTGTKETIAIAKSSNEVASVAVQQTVNAGFPQIMNKLTEQNTLQLNNILTPLAQRIKEFQEKVEKCYEVEGKERVSLQNELENLKILNTRLSAEANSLAEALTGSVQHQGSWGELQVEKVLESAGLREKFEYVSQGKGEDLRDEEGRRQKPDYLIKLPDNRTIVIDAKVSLQTYRAWCDADEASKPDALKNLIRSFENHVKAIHKAAYHHNDALISPDFTLMFVPIEGAFAAALNENPLLLEQAWSKGVVMVTPTTLYAAVRVIASVWQVEYQKQNTLAIAEAGGKVHDAVCSFLETFEGIGAGIQKLQMAYDAGRKKLVDGSGSIAKRAVELKNLGVNAQKKLELEGLKEAI